MARSLALPLRLGSSGSLAALEQDSPGEVAQSVALLLATRPGERRSVPDYGMPDPLFSGVDADVVVTTVQRWEDRADAVTVLEVATRTDWQHLIVTPDDEGGFV